MDIIEILKIINLSIVIPIIFAMVITNILKEMFTFSVPIKPEKKNYTTLYIFSAIFLILLLLTLIL